MDSEVENLLDKPLDSPIKRLDSNLSTNRQNLSKIDIIKNTIRNQRFSKDKIGKISMFAF